MTTFTERVAAKAQTNDIAKLLLNVLAFPFYLLGRALGGALVIVMWAVAAVQVGIADARRPVSRRGPGGDA